MTIRQRAGVRGLDESYTDGAECSSSCRSSTSSQSLGCLRSSNGNLRHTRTMPLIAPARNSNNERAHNAPPPAHGGSWWRRATVWNRGDDGPPVLRERSGSRLANMFEGGSVGSVRVGPPGRDSRRESRGSSAALSGLEARRGSPLSSSASSTRERQPSQLLRHLTGGSPTSPARAEGRGGALADGLSYLERLKRSPQSPGKSDASFASSHTTDDSCAPQELTPPMGGGAKGTKLEMSGDIARNVIKLPDSLADGPTRRKSNSPVRRVLFNK